MSAPNPADFLHAPLPRVGDAWVFETRLPEKARGVRLHHRVEAVQGDEIVTAVQGETGDAPVLRQGFDRQMNRRWREVEPGEALRYAPAFALFRFPLVAGETAWSLTVQQTQDGWPGSREVQIDARAVRIETVSTPAGRFEAMRIEATHRAGDARIQTVYWYCPQVRRSVRGEEFTETPRGRSALIYELLRWQPA
ncbi:MAG: hypothetical protein Fur0019_04490 [Tibeticola sp.]